MRCFQRLNTDDFWNSDNFFISIRQCFGNLFNNQFSFFHIAFVWNINIRSEEHTSELQSRFDLVCRLLLEKKKRASMPPNQHPRPKPTAITATSERACVL